MIKINTKDPVALGIASTSAYTSWSMLGYPTDIKHLIVVATTALGGITSPSQNSSSTNVQADSHIVTPYVNNIESK